MRLIEGPGDIFSSGAAALVNPVNTRGVMGRGLALEFKRRFPAAALEYERACELGTLDVGTVLVCDASVPHIIHFPTKIDWRKPSRLVYIDSGLLMLQHEIHARKIPSVAIPALGCGLGGLSWREVRFLIVGYLQHLNTVVYLYPPKET